MRLLSLPFIGGCIGGSIGVMVWIGVTLCPATTCIAANPNGPAAATLRSTPRTIASVQPELVPPNRHYLEYVQAEVVPSNRQYLEYVRAAAARKRQADAVPDTLTQWQQQAKQLRQRLYEAWGGEACFLPQPCPLEPRLHGEPLRRDGYTIERLSFQTRPGVRMTANLYVPDAARTRPAPAILMVHGHWRLAKQEPTVQLRCIGAAKLGFVVLCVDAFGAGERGVGPALGEYHGELTAATLLPAGLTLCGLQVYENMRAVDYLLTRPEVDGRRIGITGASGGGNQTMYAAAWDERFRCAVPVCSVGNYQAYLGVACCMCEVVPGALDFTEEWAVLGLIAPRPLMVINAAKDSIQFSVGEAKKSLARTAGIYKLFDRPNHLRHVTFDEGHGYSKAMREAMYGFMVQHLMGRGDGSPIPEPDLRPEDPETLRCFPGNSRPKDFVTVPELAAQQMRQLLQRHPVSLAAEERQRRRQRFRDQLGPPAEPLPAARTTWEDAGDGALHAAIQTAAGLDLPVRLDHARRAGPVVILLHLDGAAAARQGQLYQRLRQVGVRVVTADLRGTGSRAPERNRIGNAVDHNAAQWGLWLGQPLLVQWVADVRRIVEACRTVDPPPERFILIGDGPAGLVALSAGIVLGEQTVAGIGMVHTLASWVPDGPYRQQRIGTILPGWVRDHGDIGHVAALAAPIRLVIASGVDGAGRQLPLETLQELYRPAQPVTVADNKDGQAVPQPVVLTTPEHLLTLLGLPAAKE